MRKHFLILMLFALLPLAGFAQESIANFPFEIEKSSYVYSAAAPVINPTLHQPNVTTPLNVGTDYELAYLDKDGNALAAAPVTVGTYQVYAKGKGSFNGETTTKVTFAITPKNITDTHGVAPVADLSVTDFVFTACRTGEPASATYDGAAWYPTATVSLYNFDASKFKKDTDYEISYGENINAGLAENNKGGKFIVTGKGNFTGSVTAYFNIAGKNIEGCTFTFTPAASYTYTGKGQAPTFTVKDGETDVTSSFDVKWYKTTGEAVDNIAGTPEEGSPIEAVQYQAKLLAKNTSNYAGDKTLLAWRYTIAKKVINIKIKNLTSEYDGQNINLSKAEISYPGLCAADAEASLDNFGGKLEVAFAEDGAKKNVKWSGDPTPVVEGYGLKITLVDGFNGTSLFKNYQIMYDANPMDETPAVASDINITTIESVTGTYTITPKPVTYKARNIKMEYGSAKPTAPAAATLDAAAVPPTPAVVGTVEITAGGMVGEENILAALKFNVADNAVPAADPIPALAWNKAVAGETYANTLSLDWKTATNDVEDPIDKALAAAKNYDVTFVAGGVDVIGKSLTVYVNNASIEYGDDLSDFAPGYDADGQELGSVNYTICDVTTETPIESLENLAIGTYLVKIADGYTNPTNYTVKAIEPGFLVVKKKKITVTIKPLILSPGTTKVQLNVRAKVDEAYKDLLVGDDTKLTFDFAFNHVVTPTADGVEIPNSQMADAPNGEDLNVDAIDKTYSKGITATVIAWDDTKTDEQNETAGAVKANKNYQVTFVEGSLRVVAGNLLYLAQDDENLLEKINAAATKCTTVPATEYTVTFGDRAVPSEGDEWFAYVLPFDIKVKDLSKAFDYAVVNVLDVAKTGATANVNGNKYVYFKLEMNEIKANQPFLMKVYSVDETPANQKDNMSKIEFLNVKNIKAATAAVSVNSAVEGVTTFTGLYGTPVVIKKGSIDRFLATKPATATEAKVNKWWVAENSDYTVKSLDAYLKMAEGAGARIFIEDFENGTTAIKEIGVDGSAKAYNVDGWYTLNGVKLNAAPAQKGIYINNGKKVVIK